MSPGSPDEWKFPSTIWGDFLSTHGANPAAGAEPLRRLAQDYWKPIYAYIRVRWSKGAEEAQDLTQDFFLWILESGFLKRLQAGRGRFRSFLKASLENYLLDVEKRRRAIKRGGEAVILPLDWSHPPDVVGADSSSILDETWRAELMARGVERLERALDSAGKQVHFAVFKEFFLQDSASIDYKQLSARHGLTQAEVSNHLMYAKRRFREVLRELVAETVETPQDLHEEMKWLFREPGE